MIFIASSTYDPKVEGTLASSVFLLSCCVSLDIVPGTYRSRLLSASLFTIRETFFSIFVGFSLGGEMFCLECFDDVEEAPLDARECREALLRFSDADIVLFFFLTCLLDSWPSF